MISKEKNQSKKNQSKKNQSKKNQSKNIIIIALAVVAAAAIAVAVWALLSKSTNGSADAGNQGYVQNNTAEATNDEGTKETVGVLTDQIDLPQFAWLNLKADTKEQDLTFQNPPQNYAKIRVSILLPDKTVLWTSEIIAPGETSEKVVLSKALSAGEYKSSILKYECFNNDEDMTPLNGAENKLSLKVY